MHYRIQNPEHDKLVAELDQLVTEGVKYGVVL